MLPSSPPDHYGQTWAAKKFALSLSIHAWKNVETRPLFHRLTHRIKTGASFPISRTGKLVQDFHHSQISRPRVHSYCRCSKKLAISPCKCVRNGKFAFFSMHILLQMEKKLLRIYAEKGEKKNWKIKCLHGMFSPHIFHPNQCGLFWTLPQDLRPWLRLDETD